jgi:Spy/CpxP family protein refolding chaperone
MIKKTGIVIALVLPVFFSLQPGVSAQQGGEQKKKEETLKQIKRVSFLREAKLYGGRKLLRVKDELGLTAAQVEKIENLVLEQEAFCIRASAEIKIKELRFASYLESGAGENQRREIARYIREISKEKTDLIIHHMNYLLDLKELLTPRQLKILEQLPPQTYEAN